MIEKYESPTTNTVWIDLYNPTQEELQKVNDLHDSNIELTYNYISCTKFLNHNNQKILLTFPNVIPLNKEGNHTSAPLHFIITPTLIITHRTQDLPAFALTKEDIKKAKNEFTSLLIFTLIVEHMISFQGEALDKLSEEAINVNKKVFGYYRINQVHNIGRINRNLRNNLSGLGYLGARLSQIREIQLGLQRGVSFVIDHSKDILPDEQNIRLKKVLKQIEYLTDFENYLTNKIQFTLDALLGFINTEQNDIFKVLTIVSVVGIPPTFIASWYGMNFHFLPEYMWRYGYLYVIILTVFSIILPIFWFKWKGWW